MKSISYFFLLIFLLACQKDESVEPKIKAEVEVSAVGVNGATFTAELEDMGIYESLDHGFLLSSTSGVNINSSNKILLGSINDVGEFSVRTDNLEEGKEYFLKAFVADQGYNNIYYSQEVSFSTLSAAAVIQTLQPSDISSTNANLKGNLINLLQYSSLQYGFVWSTNPLPDLTSLGKIVLGEKNAPGSFSTTISGLEPGTSYHVRAFATDTRVQTIFYGNDVVFTTTP